MNLYIDSTLLYNTAARALRRRRFLMIGAQRIYDGINVLKQSANRTIILAKILSYAPRAVFPHVLEASPSSFIINDYMLPC